MPFFSSTTVSGSSAYFDPNTFDTAGPENNSWQLPQMDSNRWYKQYPVYWMRWFVKVNDGIKPNVWFNWFHAFATTLWWGYQCWLRLIGCWKHTILQIPTVLNLNTFTEMWQWILIYNFSNLLNSDKPAKWDLSYFTGEYKHADTVEQPTHWRIRPMVRVSLHAQRFDGIDTTPSLMITLTVSLFGTPKTRLSKSQCCRTVWLLNRIRLSLPNTRRWYRMLNRVGYAPPVTCSFSIYKNQVFSLLSNRNWSCHPDEPASENLFRIPSYSEQRISVNWTEQMPQEIKPFVTVDPDNW